MQATQTRRSSLELVRPGNFVSGIPEKVVELPVKSIIPNRWQVRQTFSEETLLELSRSIEENGLMQPIIVRPSSASPTVGLDSQSYELVAGERRLRAHQLLKRKNIPAIVRAVNDSEMRLQATLENWQREDLTILEKADAMILLMNELSMKKVEDVADRLGIKRSTGFLYARIGKAPPKCKQAISSNRLDIRSSDFLISIAEKVRKSGPDAEQSFNKMLEGPIDKTVLAVFHDSHFNESDEDNITTRNRKRRFPKISGHMSFWEQVKTIEKVLVKQKTVELSGKDRKHITVEAERFFKGLGAKRFNVKF